jgi:hypothetical protein
MGRLDSMLGLGQDHLSIYLNDHLAGATAGLHLARRATDRNRDTDYEPVLAAIAEELEQDRRALEHVMDRLAVGRDRARAALGWGVEQASRLKLDGELLGYSPLKRLEELEALSLGVAGKLELWTALRVACASDPRLAEIDFDELIERARSQRRQLEREHARAAEEALRR